MEPSLAAQVATLEAERDRLQAECKQLRETAGQHVRFVRRDGWVRDMRDRNFRQVQHKEPILLTELAGTPYRYYDSLSSPQAVCRRFDYSHMEGDTYIYREV